LYATQSRVDTYYTQHRGWKVAANSQGCAYVPPVTPGFNDRAIRLALNRSALSRQLSPGDSQGSFFRASLKRARSLIDKGANNLMMINSFNEWHEDTQIEPVSGEGISYAPFNLTQGLEYTVYGELYLDIIMQETLF
jgi:glycoprotein endo-alpha-1,2-mannosidase